MKKTLKNPDSRIWFCIAAIIHILVLLFLFYNIYNNEQYLKQPLQGLFLTEGDTNTYYSPLEMAFQGEGYCSTCRMPALLPIYIPLRYIFNIFWTKNIIIVIQLILGVIASTLTARIAYRLTNKPAVFYLTILISSTSFLLNKLIYYGYMDSLAVSTLIIGYYILINTKGNTLNLILSGIFIGWSVFFRQILGLNLIIAALWLLYTGFKKYNLILAVKRLIIFIIPFAIFMSIWNIYTYTHLKEIPILVKSGEKCWKGYPVQLNKVVQLVIGWGGNFTKWNGEAEWFITNNMEETDFPFDDRVMTKTYNLDSLIELRRNLLKSMDSDTPLKEKQMLANDVCRKSTKYLNSYKQENLINYYILNRLKLLIKFTIPNQIDGLILPPLQNMNILQIIAKSFWWSTFAIFNIMGFVGFFIFGYKQKKNLLLHISFMSGFFYLTFFAGLIEQRYIAPYLPFIYIYSSYIIIVIFQQFKNKFIKRR